jgi:hypothetical protein
MRHVHPAATTALMLTALLLQPTLAACEGMIDVQLEMGSAVQQRYECIFVGTVTANGKPCAGAHVEADLAGAHDQAVTEIVYADAQGHYQLHVTLEGKPQDETRWKLTAKAAVIGASAMEVEGRVILPEESTVMIDRSIQLDGSGV